MASYDEVFGSKPGNKPKVDRYINLKNEGDQFVAVLTGEHRWVNEYNPQTKKKLVKVLGEVMGKETWLTMDEGSFDKEQYPKFFEPTKLVVVARDEKGLFNFKFDHVGAEKALKEEMSNTGVGLDEGVTLGVKLVDRSTKPFTWSVRLVAPEADDE